MTEVEADKWYEEHVQPYMFSKAALKMWNYFLDITKMDYFKKTIFELRSKYNIPANGFVPQDGHYYVPPRGVEHKKEIELMEEIVEKICKKYKLHYFDFAEVIKFYVYYNELHRLSEVSSCGLMRVMDVPSEKEDPFGELVQASDDMAYPIAIRISPYASQRDIIDFIKNKVVWKDQIEFLQKKYRDKNIKIDKVKFKNPKIQERNDLIYENRNKPLKDIRKLLAEQKIFLDDGHISKIISLEKQKRKDV